MVASFGCVLLALAAAQTAPEHKASDMALIANWACGDDPNKAFERPFGDKQYLIDRKDPLLYCDLPGVETPARMKAVNYEFIQARRRVIQGGGGKVSPSVLIVRSSREDPPEGGERQMAYERAEPGERVYYVEIAIGNMGTHWFKMSVREVAGKTVVKVIFAAVS